MCDSRVVLGREIRFPEAINRKARVIAEILVGQVSLNNSINLPIAISAKKF